MATPFRSYHSRPNASLGLDIWPGGMDGAKDVEARKRITFACLHAGLGPGGYSLYSGVKGQASRLSNEMEIEFQPSFKGDNLANLE